MLILRLLSGVLAAIALVQGSVAAARPCVDHRSSHSNQRSHPMEHSTSRAPECPLAAGCGIAVAVPSIVVTATTRVSHDVPRSSSRAPAFLIQAPELPPPRG